MGNLITKVDVKTAVDSSNVFDLSCYHATTSKFYTPRITYFHEFVPNEKWKMDARCSVRCLPMIRPSIASVKVHNRFFFVPYYTIMKRWSAFLADSPEGTYDSPEIPVVPYVTEATLVQMFATVSYGYSETGAEDNYDFAYSRSGAAPEYRRFTERGRNLYSILLGLGYNINLSIDPYSSSVLSFNMLPLLAYVKVWLDWYNNSAFDTHVNMQKYFNLANSDARFTTNRLFDLFAVLDRVYMEKDYFTSASLTPVASNLMSMESHYSLPDITLPNTAAVTATEINSGINSNGTPIIKSNNQTQPVQQISKYALEAVQALTDFVHRHQVAGIQPFNRILAEYGVTLTDEELQRSTFIADVDEDLNINEILNSSYAEEQPLGQRAGFAQGGNKKNLSYHNNNYGCIICVTTIVPRNSYTDGVKRSVLRRNRAEFFTPEFEHLGVEPTFVAELKNNFTFPRVGEEFVSPVSIFGYMPRYASMKTALDTLSGSFAIRREQLLYDPWIIRRKIDGTDPDDYRSVSEDFTLGKFDTTNSPFVDPDADNFIIFNMYHVSARLPMHKLFDDYQYSNEEDNPRTVTLNNQGVQFS